jgi:translocation and assembly module TamB
MSEPTAPDLAGAPAPAPAPRTGGRLALAAGACLLGGLLSAGAGLGWVWQADAGTRWLLAHVPGAQASGVRGSLGSGQLQIEHLAWQGEAGQLTLDGLSLNALSWHWRPHAQAWLGISLGEVQAQSLHWTSATTPTPASPPLTDLRLPLSLDVPVLKLKLLQVDTLPAIEDLQASVALGTEKGSRHQVSDLRAHTAQFDLAAKLSIGSAAPLELSAEAQVHSVGQDWPWQAGVGLRGPLQTLQASAQLDGTAPAGHDTPRLSLDAELHPFAAWPLGDLKASTQALDLWALDARAPHTRLHGEVKVSSSAADQPISAKLQLVNQLAGRWDAGQAPVRSITAELRGTATDLARLDLNSLDIDWGDSRRSAGHWTGQGRYLSTAQSGQLQLDLALAQFRPALLDQRLPSMALNGPLTLSASNLPSPLPDAPAPSAAIIGQLSTQLRGLLDRDSGPGTPVKLVLDAQGHANDLRLTELSAEAAGASTRWQGQLQQRNQRWQWQVQGELHDFDPSVWWPGEPGSAWRRGVHRLNAQLTSQASLPVAAVDGGLPDWRRLQGSTSLQLAPSQLAGVPLSGSLKLDGDGKGQAKLDSQWQFASTTLAAQAQADAKLDTRWKTELQVPALEALAPWVALLPQAAPWAPKAGQLSLQASGQGAPEQHRWHGQLDLRNLSAPDLRATELKATFNGGLRLDSPGAITLSSGPAAGKDWRLKRLDAQLSGSVLQHQFKALLDSPVRPPAWMEQLLGARSGSASRVQLAGQGAWQADTPSKTAGRAGQWRGTLQELRGGAADGSGEPWLAAQGLQLSLKLNAQGQASQLTLLPGLLKLPGMSLRWTDARWAAAGSAPGQAKPEMVLNADLEPFALAPLLARAQPELGWGGDLQLAGKIRVHSAQRFDADVVFERRSGDLSIADDTADPASRIQALRLSDLRLALAAHDGVWQFTSALAGEKLGQVGGAAVVRTQPDLAWPPASAPLEGVLQLRVAKLGAWGAWVPAGWRLGGEIESSAQFGGRFGAPEVNGHLSGRQLSARQVLHGIALNEGEIEMTLKGPVATVERFRFKGGEGTVTAKGSATLGEQPAAEFSLTADHFLTLGRIDRRLVTSGNAKLLLSKDQFSLTGKMQVDEGLIDFSRGEAPTLDDDVTVIDTSVPLPTGDGAAKTAARTAQLDVTLDLGQKLRVKGKGLDTRLRGDLRITNPGGKLSVKGTVSTDKGTFAAYGQKLEIERGVLRFVGPVEDPRLDIYAVRPNLDISVGVAVTGSALNPRVRLASDSDMSDTDKLSWLVLGRASDGLGQADTALLQRAAMALLAGDGDAPSDALLKTIGLTDFGVRQDGTGDTKATVVSLGKQISQRWYVGYERSVNSTTGAWQLIYRAAQRFTLRAQSGDDSALDMIWTWRWN